MKITWKRIKASINNRTINVIDRYYDQRICGQSLAKYVPSVFRDDKNGIGMTGSESTNYIILKRIFAQVKIRSEDVFLDVGCGKGRVLAFLIKEDYPCVIHGIEINEISGKIATEWAKKYNNVHVEIGDAFEVDFNQYTVLFLGRPFLPKTFFKFLEILEQQLTHPITFIYWVDQQSGYMLKDRIGWKLKYRELISEIHGLKICDGHPQSFSVWEYDPIQYVPPTT